MENPTNHGDEQSKTDNIPNLTDTAISLETAQRSPGALALHQPQICEDPPQIAPDSEAEVNGQLPLDPRGSEASPLAAAKVAENSGMDWVANANSEAESNDRSTDIETSIEYGDDEDEGEDEDEEEEEDIDGADGEEYDDDDGPLVENPSTDIRLDLQRALKSTALDFKGTYYFQRTYPVAPNPFLHVSDFGYVGLPLTPTVATDLIRHCRQAPFGMGERTIVDTSVRDTWELDASKVGFTNPAWQTFLDQAVREVCTTLGVNHDISRPRCELYKLLVYAPGSHFLPHQDTEKVNGMFASMIVVLPSPFTGGAVHLSHGEQATVLDCSAGGMPQTSILAWYTDITHEVKPITAGYRLALSYNLIHTTNALRPSLPATHSVVNVLRHILLSWKQQSDATPFKLIYLLDHEYTSGNLSGSALKGADAHKVALLSKLAEDLGFTIALANVECYQQGSTNDYGQNYHRRRHCYYDDEDEDEDDDDDISMVDIDTREMKIEGVVDLDGCAIAEDIDCDDEEEMIPSNLQEKIESGVPDEEEKGGYTGNEGGTMERWYRATVLLIWPDLHNIEIDNGGDLLSLAADLRTSNSAAPTYEERRVTKYLFRAAASNRVPEAQVAHGVCYAAARWNDLDMWKRCVRECDATKSVAALSEEGIIFSIQQLGFENVQPTIETILRNEASNTARYALLDKLQELGTSAEPDIFPAGWVDEQRKIMIRSLKSLNIKDDPKLLLNMIRKNGGTIFLETTILPQIKTLGTPEFMTSFASLLNAERQSVGQAEDEQAAVDRVIKQLLRIAVSKVDFYQTKPPTAPQQGYHSYYHPAQPVANPDIAQRYIQACIRTGNEAIAGEIIDRLINMTGIAPQVAQKRATAVLLPLIPILNKMLGSQPNPLTARPLPGLEKLCKTTIELYVGQISPANTPPKGDLSSLLQAVAMGGPSDVLQKTVLPKLKSLPWNETFYRDLITELQARRAEIAFPGGLTTSMTNIINKMMEDAIPKMSMNSTQGIMNALNLCLETGGDRLAGVVLSAAVQSGRLSQLYITTVLVPLLPELQKLCTLRRISPTSEPFAAVFKSIVIAWTNKILGAKPADMTGLLESVKRIGCRCAPCAEAVRFLVSSPAKEHMLNRIGAPKRRHVEAELQRHASQVASWVLIQTTPQGLKITKKDSVFAIQRWKSEQAKGAAILRSVSLDARVLHGVLGRDYVAVMELLTGTKVAIPPAAPATSRPSLAAAPPPAVSGPSRPPLAQPAAQASRPQQQQRPIPVPSTSSRPVAPVAPKTPAPTKRKRSIEEDIEIIDLTTPYWIYMWNAYAQHYMAPPYNYFPSNPYEVPYPVAGPLGFLAYPSAYPVRPPAGFVAHNPVPGNLAQNVVPQPNVAGHVANDDAEESEDDEGEETEDDDEDGDEDGDENEAEAEDAEEEEEEEDDGDEETGSEGEENVNKFEGSDAGSVTNLSEDIKNDLEEALEGDIGFSGSFFYKTTHSDAPNPALHLDNLGLVGLPLSDWAAKIVISRCKHAPFGQGERTIVDASVRDTWEMDALNVHIRNPAWKTFLDNSVKDVCTALGVDYDVSRPRCELYKLLVYETGSHFLPHQDTEKVDGMFASIIVVLPSRFSGGAVHLSHSGLSATLDCSAESLLQTTVLAWYTDVVHEVKPITGGYRLALAYNLIHTTNTLRPSLSSHNAISNLRDILLSWKHRTDVTPLKIIYLLDHKYSRANLRGSALKGNDAHKVGLLDLLAKKHGFRLALANLEYHISGYPNEYDGEDIGMEEIDFTETMVTNIVDLDGNLIMNRIACDETETIPGELGEVVESQKHDQQEYEGYQGNSGGTLERWYRRTVLVIWPHLHDLVIRGGVKDLPSYALKTVREISSSQPDKQELRLVGFLLRAAQNGTINKSSVVQCVCRAATLWKSLDLWHRAIKTCCDVEGVRALGTAAILDAVTLFRFPKIKPVYVPTSYIAR